MPNQNLPRWRLSVELDFLERGDVRLHRVVEGQSPFVGKDPPPSPDLPSCTSNNGYASYGSKYLAVANATQGLVESICEEDFAPIVEKLGLTLSGLSVDFELSEFPQLETLQVALYADATNESKIKDLVIDQDFTYNADKNALHFQEEQVPQSEYYIVARYEISATPSDTATSDTDATEPDGGTP